MVSQIRVFAQGNGGFNYGSKLGDTRRRNVDNVVASCRGKLASEAGVLLNCGYNLDELVVHVKPSGFTSVVPQSIVE